MAKINLVSTPITATEIKKRWDSFYSGKEKIKCDENCHDNCEGNHGYYPPDFEYENLFEEKI